MMSGRNRYPFSATQWEELQIQALIFKYLVSGIPIPPDLIFTIKRSFSYQPQHAVWNCFKGRKLDTELGRCKRTDGKKWRCSKQAYIDSKYCEKHMHRGKNRSRKPVETCATTMAFYTASTPNQSLSLSLSFSDKLKDRHEVELGSSKDDSWQFTPLTMSSSSSSSSNHRKMHRFFDEWPPKHRDKSSNYSS